jgi:hypothetical protein
MCVITTIWTSHQPACQMTAIFNNQLYTPQPILRD